jgi:2-octaprenyl-6-methoxyphenol hydroxylase
MLTIEQKSDTKAQILNADLAIVGGGIAGLTLAAALAKSGINLILIEGQTQQQAAAKRQAYALSLMSGRIFEGIGVWAKILPNIGKFRHIKLSDADYPKIVEFQTSDLNTEYLGYVAEHKIVATELQDYLHRFTNVTWLCPGEVLAVEYGQNEAKIAVKMGETTQIVETKLVIGADGAKSKIRAWANITTQGWKYWQSCVAFTIKHTAPRNDIAFERFCYSGPMGVLPLPDNRCQIVWTAPHEDAQNLQNISETEFLEKLKVRLKGVLGEFELVSPRLLFPVQLMQSKQYIKPRLALIGDAAHCCHPLGGQGLNLGIRDAAALAEVLSQAYTKGEDIGDINVLKKYENWRKLENWTILGFVDILNRVFSNQFLPVMIIRRFGILLMKNIHFLKIQVLQLMTGLKGRFAQLVLRKGISC